MSGVCTSCNLVPSLWVGATHSLLSTVRCNPQAPELVSPFGLPGGTGGKSNIIRNLLPYFLAIGVCTLPTLPTSPAAGVGALLQFPTPDATGSNRVGLL